MFSGFKVASYLNMVDKTLLIDDSDIDLFIQRRFLEVYNFSKQLIILKSAIEALDWLKSDDGQAPPDVIFLDLNMPQVDGFAFLKRFETLSEKIIAQTKIVVLTSSNSATDREEAFLNKNVIDFITKPIRQSDIEKVQRLLHRR